MNEEKVTDTPTHTMVNAAENFHYQLVADIVILDGFQTRQQTRQNQDAVAG
jgi:hypothetical protein